MTGRRRSNRRIRDARASQPEPSYAEILTLASSEAVANAMSRLGPVTGPGAPLDQSENSATTLLAGEQVAHLIEAWRYMGAAIRSAMCNAPDNSIHFAYYAQLRSALSIFAASGVRVKQNDCFYVTEDGARADFGRGARTHTLVWSLWDEWANTSYANKLMGRNVSIAGVPLEQIPLVPTNAGPVLSTWGYDLAKGSIDREARNSVSYEANSRTPCSSMDDGSVDLIGHMWSLLLQDGEGVLFDAALVRFFIDRYVDTMIAQPTEEDEAVNKELLLDRIVNQTSASTGVSASTLQDLLDADVNLKLFEVASLSEANAENVLSRGLFLARMATLALSVSLSRYAAVDCKTWIVHWLARVGLYNKSVHVRPGEIAADYELAVEEFLDVDKNDLPASLWEADIAHFSAKLARPEAFVAWSLPLDN